MSTIILFGFLAGLDNLEVAPVLGIMRMPPVRRWTMIAAFGLFEAIMPLIGLSIGHLIERWFVSAAEKLGPVVLLLCAALIIFSSLTKIDLSKFMSSGWVIVGLPLCLSIDNLFAGIGLGTLGYPVILSAFLIGLISSVMCMIGVFFGRNVTKWVPKKAELLSGVYLAVLAVVKLF